MSEELEPVTKVRVITGMATNTEAFVSVSWWKGGRQYGCNINRPFNQENGFQQWIVEIPPGASQPNPKGD